MLGEIAGSGCGKGSVGEVFDGGVEDVVRNCESWRMCSRKGIGVLGKMCCEKQVGLLGEGEVEFTPDNKLLEQQSYTFYLRNSTNRVFFCVKIKENKVGIEITTYHNKPSQWS